MHIDWLPRAGLENWIVLGGAGGSGAGCQIQEVPEVAHVDLAWHTTPSSVDSGAPRRFRDLLADEAGKYVVPDTVPALSTRRVLATTLLPGIPVDGVAELDQEVRDDVSRRLLNVTLRELFEFNVMQSDPNWGNYLYDADSDKLGLIDFGAAREYPKRFTDEYLRLVLAAADGDRDGLIDSSVVLGFLTGRESPAMMHAHAEAGLIIGEPFRDDAPYDFAASSFTQRVAVHAKVFARERLAPPPPEVYSLHRRLSGAFLTCIRLGAVIPCRDLLVDMRDKILPADEHGRGGGGGGERGGEGGQGQ